MLASALLGTSGCPTRDKYDRTPTVRITSPTADKYTNGHVTITAAIQPDLELPIVLRRDGTTELKTLEPPLYTFDWDTTSVPEGAHPIVAEVELSNGTARSAPVTIVVDRQPPTVASVSPSPGATNVTLRSAIQVFFSEAVVLSQPADATFTLSTGTTTIETTAKLDPSGRAATIAIDDMAALGLPAALTGTVAATITDRAGNAILSPTSWSWNVPDFIKIPNLAKPVYPRLAVGSDLKPVLAWSQILPNTGVGDYQLHVSKFDGVGWSDFGPPSSDLNSGAGGYSVTLDAQDRPFVCWTETSAASKQEIHVASWTGTAWDTSRPKISPSFGPTSLVQAPVIRIDGAGHPVVMRQEVASSGLFEILLARWNGTTWDPAFGGIEFANNAAMDMVIADNPIVSWILPAGTGHVSTWSGTTWTAAADRAAMSEPYLALDAGHNPMIVTGGAGSFIVQHLVAGGTWQLLPAAAVPPQAMYPRIAAGPDGLPVLAYYDAQTVSVGMARWTGQRWDTRAFAFGVNAVDAAPQLVVDRQGTAWIGWRDHSNLESFTLWMSNF
jgi:hypothetical protein